MNETLKWLKAFAVALGGLITNYLGGWDTVMRALLTFVVLDYLTGLAAAWYERKLDSGVGARGILKKILLFAVVGLAYQIDKSLGQEVFRSLATWFYLANEALSVLENVGRAGVPIPGFLRAALEQLKDTSDTGEQANSSD